MDKVQQVFYALTRYFLNLMKLLVPFASHDCFPHRNDAIIIFMDDGWKLFSQKLVRESRASIRKNLARQFFIFKVMFVVGYYNEFTAARRQMFCTSFVKEKLKLLVMNPMCISAPWADSLEIIALHPVKKNKGSTQWLLVPLGILLLRLLTCSQKTC